MMRWMAAIYSKLKRAFVFLIEDVSMLWYIGGFAIATILFGILYTCLTPHGHGIGQDFKPLSDVTYPVGIYFSIVTISSLGYGDMHPMGISMALASLEVLFGLGLIGIMIAKVTSQRLSYHVSRLFASDTQKRLEGIAEKFEDSVRELRAILRILDVPSQTQESDDRKSEFSYGFEKSIGELRLRCVELYDYISFEIERGGYFKVAPVIEMERVGKAVNGTFNTLSQLLIGMSPQTRNEILDRQTSQDISVSVDLQKKVCDLVCGYATNQNIIDTFEETKVVCTNVPASYYEVPEVPQPDQIPQDADEPQDYTGIDNETPELPKEPD